jgi:hypothetical protein
MIQITEATKHEIKRAMQEYQARHSLSNAKMAQQCGISTAYMSTIVNERWNEMKAGGKTVVIDDKYFQNIANTIGFKLKESDWGHFDTDNFRMIFDIINESRVYKYPAAVDGDTGLGKTYAIQEYRRQFPKETYIIECAGDFTAKRLMKELAQQIGLNPAGTMTDLRLKVVQRLRRDRDPVLIVDEAENLPQRAWHSIKKLLDDVSSNTNRMAGVVFFGANKFEDVMQARANRMREPFPQVHSRIKEGGYYSLFAMNFDDKKKILTALGITDRQVINVLDSRCDNMRELYGAVMKLRREQRKSGKQLNELIEIIL